MTRLDPLSNEANELLSLALLAARRAAAFVLEGWRKRPDTESKLSGIDLVTRFDRESEGILREALAASGLPVVGEETGGEPGGLTWYVDPLDGTTNFVHGHPFWCVSVGLVDGRQPCLGAVVAPSLSLEWTSITGGSAFRNGERCRVSTTAVLADAMLATGFPYDRATNPDNNLAEFTRVKRRARAVRRCGSAAIDLCFVADGTYDAYWEKRLRPWDLAAGASAVLASGGQLSSMGGGPADLIQGDLVASNGLVHAELVEILVEAARDPVRRAANPDMMEG